YLRSAWKVPWSGSNLEHRVVTRRPAPRRRPMITATPVPAMQGLTVSSPELVEWITELAELTQPDRIFVCDGSQAEYDRLCSELVAAGTFTRLDPQKRPGSFLARSAPSDVARVESRTFICSEREEDAGPTNNWAEPTAMREELTDVFAGSMRGRTMYVVPFSMGPVGGPISQLGVEVTDSPYVVASMRVMTRMGAAALEQIERGAPWVPAVHSVGYPLADGAGHTREDVPWPC